MVPSINKLCFYPDQLSYLKPMNTETGVNFYWVGPFLSRRSTPSLEFSNKLHRFGVKFRVCKVHSTGVVSLYLGLNLWVTPSWSAL